MISMDYLIHLIQIAGYWGYAILFLNIFLESFPPTSILPGDSLLFTTGFLASQGYFNLFALFVVLTVASILGYMFTYAVGRKLRKVILKGNDEFWFKKRHIEYTEKFFAKHGAKTLVLGRFIPVIRSFGPTLAGAVEMPYKRFIRFNIIGGVVWAVGLTTIGFFLGKAIPKAHVYLTPIIIVIIFVSFIPVVIEYISERRKTSKL